MSNAPVTARLVENALANALATDPLAALAAIQRALLKASVDANSAALLDSRALANVVEGLGALGATIERSRPLTTRLRRGEHVAV